ncbi:MAG: ABC transporter permease [Candidatus Solibacter sp.]|jgi:predicted permease
MIENLRRAQRALRRDPILWLTATLTLALCIGANTTVFSLVDSILLRPLPFPNADRIYWVSERMGKSQAEIGIGADYYSLREAHRVFAEVGAFDTLTLNWNGREKPEQLDAAQVTHSFFTVLGARPMIGRYLAAEEEGRKAPAVVVVSYPFWRARLGGDPHAVGQTLALDGLAHTIVGVMPRGFDYPKGTQIWRPLQMDESGQRPRSVMRPMRLVNMLARRQPALTGEQLEAQMPQVTASIRAEYPADFEKAGFLDGMRILATPLQRRITGDLRPALVVLGGAVLLVLLIACANLANLLLARAAAREREMAVRMALGSGKARVVRQMLKESLLLAVPGGLAGIALAWVAIELLNAWQPLVLSRYPPVAMDLRTLAFTVALTLITGLVFGLAPALGVSGVKIQEALKSAGSGYGGSRGSARVRRLLVVVELGVSLVLLIASGLLAKSFLNLARTELGFPVDHLLTLRLNLTGPEYAAGKAQTRYYAQALERVRQLPMVRSAAVSTDLPLTGDRPFQSMPFQVAGRVPLPMAQRPQASVTIASLDFFRTMGMPLRSGRLIQVAEQEPDNVVVNEAFARQIFPGEDPLGQRIVFGRNDASRWTIVGVVGSIRGSELGAEPEPCMYRAIGQSEDRFLSLMRLSVRTTGDPLAVRRAVEGQLYAVDRSQPVFDVKSMEQRVADTLAPQRLQLLLIGTFAAMAVILAALGVYGVMAYLVTRRTREIGIRMAIGARPEQVRGQILRESLALAATAVAAGVAGAWGLTRYLGAMLYGVTPLDGVTFSAAALVLVAVALAASLVPARKASRVDPVVALREE